MESPLRSPTLVRRTDSGCPLLDHRTRVDEELDRRCPRTNLRTGWGHNRRWGRLYVKGRTCVYTYTYEHTCVHLCTCVRVRTGQKSDTRELPASD